jgi:hypothetical protein
MPSRTEPSAEETARVDREELDKAARAEAEQLTRESQGKTTEHAALSELLARMRSGGKPNA